MNCYTHSQYERLLVVDGLEFISIEKSLIFNNKEVNSDYAYFEFLYLSILGDMGHEDYLYNNTAINCIIYNCDITMLHCEADGNVFPVYANDYDDYGDDDYDDDDDDGYDDGDDDDDSGLSIEISFNF